jgi:hypothetical protein
MTILVEGKMPKQDRTQKLWLTLMGSGVALLLAIAVWSVFKS